MLFLPHQFRADNVILTQGRTKVSTATQGLGVKSQRLTQGRSEVGREAYNVENFGDG
jgi:hypothetical protein